MKRLTVSLLILALVMLVCGFGTCFVTENYKKITRELTLGEECMKSGDAAAAKEHCEKAEKIYYDNEQYMAAFVNHSILDEIGAVLSGVAPLADGDSVPEFLSICAEAKTSLTHLRNDHIFLIGNLF